jgi:hypothetical protein
MRTMGAILLAGAAVAAVLGFRLSQKPDTAAPLTFNIPVPAISPQPVSLTSDRARSAAEQFLTQQDFRRRGYVYAGMRKWGPGWRVYLVPKRELPHGAATAPAPSAPKGRMCLDLRLRLGAVVSTGLSPC